MLEPIVIEIVIWDDDTPVGFQILLFSPYGNRQPAAPSAGDEETVLGQSWTALTEGL